MEKVNKKSFVLIKNNDNNGIILLEKYFEIKDDTIVGSLFQEFNISSSRGFRNVIRQVRKYIKQDKIVNDYYVNNKDKASSEVPFNRIIVGNNNVIGIDNYSNRRYTNSLSNKSLLKLALKSYKQNIKKYCELTGIESNLFNNQKIFNDFCIYMKYYNELMSKKTLTEEDYVELYNLQASMIETTYPKVQKKRI